MTAPTQIKKSNGPVGHRQGREAIDQAVAPLASAVPAQPGKGTENSGATHVVRSEVDGVGEAFLNWSKGTGGQDGRNTGLPFSVELTSPPTTSTRSSPRSRAARTRRSKAAESWWTARKSSRPTPRTAL